MCRIYLSRKWRTVSRRKPLRTILLSRLSSLTLAAPRISIAVLILASGISRVLVFHRLQSFNEWGWMQGVEVSVNNERFPLLASNVLLSDLAGILNYQVLEDAATKTGVCRGET
ncbi:hypothetical protein JOB18_033890 [Solea senegalensis]|uniref:Uncharacterized protein n=1 Tax=Solea senegalensis TaxID=28829 RepID=A0AAV6QV81_SOLSE|nr:hypothetical protein JOB18_033890 [Solea senegalensis]